MLCQLGMSACDNYLYIQQDLVLVSGSPHTAKTANAILTHDPSSNCPSNDIANDRIDSEVNAGLRWTIRRYSTGELSPGAARPDASGCMGWTKASFLHGLCLPRAAYVDLLIAESARESPLAD